MEKLLNIPSVNRKVFPKHFLAAVHCEIGILGLPSGSILKTEKELNKFFTSKGFQSAKKIFHNQFSMDGAGGDKPAVITQKAIELGLLFSSQRPRRDIQILENKIVISDLNYEGFEVFSAILSEACQTILKLVVHQDQATQTEPKVNKVGLRKINSIIIEPVLSYQDACAIFSQPLFAQVRSGLLSQDSLRAHEEVTVLERGTSLCVLRAKMQKLATPSSYEANLDFDFVDLTQTTVKQVFEETLPKLNKAHFDLFMWSATEELIKLMESK